MPRTYTLLTAAVIAGATVLAPRAAGAGEKKARPPLAEVRLDDPSFSRLALLEAFHDAETERPGPVRLYMTGRWGRWDQEPWMELAWSLGGRPALLDQVRALVPLDFSIAGEERWTAREQAWSFSSSDETAPSIVSVDGLAALAAPATAIGFDALWSPSTAAAASANPPLSPQPWCRRRPVTFVRYGGETDTFALVACDGRVAPEALDRLSLMARPPEVPRPGELLPDEPDDAAWARGEWIDSVRPVNARLLWLLQRIADAFPRRVIYVFSGYRPKGSGNDSMERAKSMHSMHGEARAMDISVYGIRNEDLFRFCRTLDDVGCGYYPHSKFVHVDVRKPRTGHAFWVDASGPGQPSQYVDSWPGVVESGAMVWNKKAAERAPAPDATETPVAGTAATLDAPSDPAP